jgi:hypothetical protein
MHPFGRDCTARFGRRGRGAPWERVILRSQRNVVQSFLIDVTANCNISTNPQPRIPNQEMVADTISIESNAMTIFLPARVEADRALIAGFCRLIGLRLFIRPARASAASKLVGEVASAILIYSCSRPWLDQNAPSETNSDGIVTINILTSRANDQLRA